MFTADQGPKAIELAKQERPDVILLDMLLPGMTGPDALRALTKDASTNGIPVVAFNGLSQKNATPLEKDGARAFPEKSAPDSDKGPEALLAALAEIFGQLKLELPAGVATPKATGAWGSCAQVFGEQNARSLDCAELPKNDNAASPGMTEIELNQSFPRATRRQADKRR